jgi:hypothetical protein
MPGKILMHTLVSKYSINKEQRSASKRSVQTVPKKDTPANTDQIKIMTLLT